MVEGLFSVICNKCNTQHDFPAVDTDFGPTGGDSDRQMGPEEIYTWDYEFECECGNEIEIEYWVSEYPSGAYNHDGVDVKGATEQGGYTFSFHQEEEPDDYDEIHESLRNTYLEKNKVFIELDKKISQTHGFGDMTEMQAYIKAKEEWQKAHNDFYTFLSKN